MRFSRRSRPVDLPERSGAARFGDACNAVQVSLGQGIAYLRDNQAEILVSYRWFGFGIRVALGSAQAFAHHLPNLAIRLCCPKKARQNDVKPHWASQSHSTGVTSMINRSHLGRMLIEICLSPT